MCASCDRYLCAACIGSNLVAIAGISCLCASTCPRCREQTVRGGELESCREEMQIGVCVTITLPKKSGFFSGGSTGSLCRKVPAWLTIDVDSSEIRWATLEQQNGRPAEEGVFSVCEVLSVRDTGVTIELSLQGQTMPSVLEFNDATDRSSWGKYLCLAVDVLTPESERASLDALRAGHRQRELEERRILNEERKKKLSENLGMRYTAEAMARMPSSSGSAGKR